MDIQKILMTACGMFIDTIILISYFNCYKLKANRKLCLLALYTLYFGINFMLGILEQPLWSKTSCNIVMIMVVGYLLYDKMSVYSIGKEALIFVLFLGMAELLIIPFIFWGTGSYNTEIFHDVSQSYLWVASMGLSRTFAVCLFKLYRKKQIWNYDKLDKQEIVILYLPLAISFTCFLVITKWVMNFSYIGKENLINSLILFVCALLSSTVIHMISFEKYINYRDNIQSFFMLTQKNNLQYQYYKNQAETYDNMRILYHDLKNHMLISQLDTVYKDRLGKVLEHFEKFSDTGNDILNILLWVKYNEAGKLGIEIDSQINKVDFSFMDDLDLCSIWGNLLDNAIEACSEINSTQFPKIVLRVAKVNELILIKVENNCVGIRKKMPDGLFRTTKEEKKLHGIGIKSVRRAIEKYEGSCEFECLNDRFITKILIPGPINQ